MRPNSPARLWRSTSVRMVLLNAALTTALAAGLVVFVTWLAIRFMAIRIDDAVMDEVHVMQAELSVAGQGGLVGLIKQRLMGSPYNRKLYLLVDLDGKKVIGNVEALPRVGRDANGWMQLPGIVPGEASRMRARTFIMDDGSRLLIAFDTREIDQVRNAIRRAAGLGLTGTLLLACLAGYLTSRVALRRIDSINRTAHHIIDGDLGQRVPLLGTNDEFDQLGGTLNEMLDRINELMAAVRSATDGIAHDLRTPLARLKTRIESAKNQAGMPQELLDTLATEADRVLSIFGSLLRLTTIQSGALRSRFKPVRIGSLLNDAVQLYEAVASERDIGIALSPISEPVIHGDRDLLFQAVCNLLDNAVKFSPDGGQVRVEVATTSTLLSIAICDEGPGVPEAERERVFERLVRLDTSRGTPGFGLGLSLVRAIAQLHGGDCRIEPGASRSCVVLTLAKPEKS